VVISFVSQLIGTDVQVLSRLFLSTAEFINLKPVEEGPLSYPICVLLSATFEEVVAKFDLARVHRIYVIDDDQVPIGVISLFDILQTMLE